MLSTCCLGMIRTYSSWEHLVGLPWIPRNLRCFMPVHPLDLMLVLSSTVQLCVVVVQVLLASGKE